MTTLGILESVTLAHSAQELMQLTGRRSIYSEKQLKEWTATKNNPVKVINYLLVAYIEQPITLSELQKITGFSKRPP
jgi:hypothetical protein